MAKTHHNNGGGVFTSERKMALEPKLATKHPLCQSKTEANQAERLANQQEEDNHENGKKQFIYAMNIKSNGKSRLKWLWAIWLFLLASMYVKAIETPTFAYDGQVTVT